MTYLRDGIEYLYEDEQTVYDAIKAISAAGRTTNNSQIARYTGISNGRVATVVTELRMRGFIHNTSKGAAYHWRVTGQPVPYSRADRDRDRAIVRRQRELNEGIRAQAKADPFAGIPNADGAEDYRPAAEVVALSNETAAPHGWEVKTFDGQRLVAIGTFNDEETARNIARGHREHGFTTRVRPAEAYGTISSTWFSQTSGS